jgi:hypothetical protein
MRSFVTCTLHQILLRWSNQGGMWWAGHVARAGYMRNKYSSLVGKPEANGPLGNLGCDGRKILKWILGKWCKMLWTGGAQDRDHWPGCCWDGNEPFGCIKFGEFLTSWLIISFSRRTVLHGVSQSCLQNCRSLSLLPLWDDPRVFCYLYIFCFKTGQSWKTGELLDANWSVASYIIHRGVLLTANRLINAEIIMCDEWKQ